MVTNHITSTLQLEGGYLGWPMAQLLVGFALIEDNGIFCCACACSTTAAYTVTIGKKPMANGAFARECKYHARELRYVSFF